MDKETSCMKAQVDQRRWQDRLVAGIGGPELSSLRTKVARTTALGLIEAGSEMSRPDVTENIGNEVDAVGFLLQMAGELGFAAGRLLTIGQHYAGAALLRQVTEIEYLTWNIKEKHRNALAWLKSTHAERMRDFGPAQLRKTSKGRFLDKDYRDHCEQGGHPTFKGVPLLGGRNKAAAQLLLVDLLTHSWRTWDQVVVWSKEFPRAARVVSQHSHINWRLHEWGKQDPLYLLMVERYPDLSLTQAKK